MDKLLSYVVRCVVWLSAFMKPLSRLGLCHYEEWKKGERLKILLVGYNGARNTGADARVVALTQQLEEEEATPSASFYSLYEESKAEAEGIVRASGLPLTVCRPGMIVGTLNAGHPGGMLPLTAAEAATLHSPELPDNLYVADATILPRALGLPPMLTIMALAKRIAKIICG